VIFVKKWVVYFEELETVNRLEEMGILSYKPLLHEELKFVFIKTDLAKEDILKIEGITDCRPEAIGKIFV
jgi:hypothetical protein